MDRSFGILYSPWNHTRGWLDWLDRAHGEVGLDHLTLPVVTGAREQFRPSAGDDAHCTFTEGGWHFSPQTKRYVSKAKPRAVRGGPRDALAQIAETAETLRLKLVFRVDPRGVRALWEHEPHLRARNAWGEETPTGGVCICNADLRELLRATLDDLTRYQPAGFALQNWELDRAADLHAPRPLRWHPPVRELLDICFCAACRDIGAGGGVDPEQAARSLRVHVERLLAQPPVLAADARVQNDAVLQDYLKIRHENARAWLERLAGPYAQLRRLVLRDVRPAVAENDEKPLSPGGSIEKNTANATADAGQWAALAVLSTEAPISAYGVALRPHLRLCAPRGGLSVRAWRPVFDEAPELVKLVTEAASDGVGFFDFELEEAPTEAVTWLKQAVRFARRG